MQFAFIVSSFKDSQNIVKPSCKVKGTKVAAFTVSVYCTENEQQQKKKRGKNSLIYYTNGT